MRRLGLKLSQPAVGKANSLDIFKNYPAIQLEIEMAEQLTQYKLSMSRVRRYTGHHL